MTLEVESNTLRTAIDAFNLDALIQSFQERTETMRVRRESLTRDWDQLTQALSGLIERVDDEAFTLGDAGLKAVVALTDLADPLDEDSQTVEVAVTDALEGVTGLALGARELGDRLSSLLIEKALKPAYTVLTDAEELVDAAVASLDVVASLVGPEFLEVAENSRELARLNADVAGKVGASTSTALAGDFEDWARRMRHAVKHVDERGYTPARSHALQAVDAALAQCRAEQDPVFQTVASSLDTLLETVLELLQVMGRVDLVSFDRTTRLTDGAEGLGNALAAACTALAGAREFIESRGYGPGAS